jgi:hypothetical protein
VHVASLDRATPVVLQDQPVAVVQESRRAGRIRHLVQAPHRVISQRRRLRAARARQPILGVVGERREAVRREVTVQVPAECRSAGPRDLRVLVQTVPGIRLVDGLDWVIVDAIVLGAGGHLTGRAVRKSDAKIIGRRATVQVVTDPIQARDPVEQDRRDGAGRVAADPMERLVKRRLSVYDDP